MCPGIEIIQIPEVVNHSMYNVGLSDGVDFSYVHPSVLYGKTSTRKKTQPLKYFTGVQTHEQLILEAANSDNSLQ